jgi:hypothetical protein
MQMKRSLNNNEQNISLISSFGLDEGLKINKKDLRLLREKIDSFKQVFDEKNSFSYKSRIDQYDQSYAQDINFSNQYDFDNLTIPPEARKIFIMSQLKNNSIIFLFSLSSLLYFTKISNYLTKINSLMIFKPVFLFTFCAAPLGISLYYSKINWQYYKLDYINKKNKI